MFDRLSELRSHRQNQILAGTALVVLSAGLGLRDPWPPDEPALALMARQMAESGEWLIPFLGSEPFAGHPPFAIWIMAAFYSVTGSMRLALLLPSLLACLGTLWVVYDIGKRLWGSRTGRLAATLLLCTFQFMLQAHSGQVDAILMFWSTLGVYALLRFMLLEDSRRWLQVAGASIGFGILTKGVGYLPLLLLIPYAWMRFKSWSTLPPRAPLRHWWPALLTAFGMVLAWTLPALAFVSGADDKALDDFRRELLVNLAGGADLFLSQAPHDWWYLPLQALVLWLPLSLLLPWKLAIWRERLRARDAAITLLFGYIILVIAFFSVLPGKHGVQLLPAVPAAALLVAPYLGGLWWRPGVQRLSWALLLLVAAALSATALLGGVLGAEIHPRITEDVPPRMWLIIGVIAAIAALTAAVVAGRRRALGLPVFLLLGWFVFGWFAYPGLNELRTPRAMMARVAEVLPVGAELGFVDAKEQFLLLADRPGRDFGLSREPEIQLHRALSWARESKQRWLFGPRELLLPIADPSRVVVLGTRHRRDWVIVPGAALKTHKIKEGA